MIKIKKREKVIIAATAAVLLVFFLQNFFISAIRSKLKETNNQIRLGEEKLKQGLGIEKEKDRIKQDYKTYSEYLRIDPKDREIVAKFLKEVENITQMSGILVLNLTPENQPEEMQEFKKFKADLKAEGSMEQIFNFLFRIQQSKLLLKLDKVSITPKDEAASSLRIETTVSIAVL